MKLKKTLASLAILASGAVAMTACGPTAEQHDQYKEVESRAAGKTAYIPKNDTELDNYNKAQELYDDPAAIQFCSAFPSSNSAPIVTTPIAGKLTTSSTSYFSPTEVWEGWETAALNVPKRSVDGLFHGDSFYRYGFTPAGQYVDFSNSMELMCTTALTDFQRQKTFVEGVNTDANVDQLQADAEKALKDGDTKKATDILKGGK